MNEWEWQLLEEKNPVQSIEVRGITFQKGDRVRLRPKAGGVALVIFGAGLVLSNPTVRRYMSQMGVGNLATSALPDIERYFRLRSM